MAAWKIKPRLEEALTLVASDVPVTVTWRPFELNPTMPMRISAIVNAQIAPS